MDLGEFKVPKEPITDLFSVQDGNGLRLRMVSSLISRSRGAPRSHSLPAGSRRPIRAVLSPLGEGMHGKES
jgi:hypothetical protein